MSQVHDHSAWDAIVLAAIERAGARQVAMIGRYGLDTGTQYRWTMEDARITWSRDGVEYLTGRLTMIGSVSLSDRTWLWSWANPSIPPLALGNIERVRRYGEANDFPVLPYEALNYSAQLVNEARVVSAAVLDAEGLWTDTSNDMELHFLIHDLKLLDP
jgi:hypothetical protein